MYTIIGICIGLVLYHFICKQTEARADPAQEPIYIEDEHPYSGLLEEE